MSADIGLAAMSELLRTRRHALSPEDVGLPPGRRRRARGLRREEVAALCSISVSYYTRLERHCAPRPSPPILAGIARGLRFDRAQRDRLFRAAGVHGSGMSHLDPGLMLVLTRLADTPALVIDPIGEIVHQTPAGKALLGDLTGHTGRARSSYYRWFADPESRHRHAVSDHSAIGAAIAVELRRSADCAHSAGAARGLVRDLLRRHEEFAAMWHSQTPSHCAAAIRHCRIVHPELGLLDLRCEVLTDGDPGHRVVIYLADPGTESRSKLQMLPVIGHHRFDADASGVSR